MPMREVDREDPMFAPFWAGTDVGEIRVQRCCACGRHRWPPRPMCPACQSTLTEWTPGEPSGILFGWTVVQHPTVPGVEPPYTVGLVELPVPCVRMIGQIVGADPASVVMGMHLEARFVPSPAGVTLVNWAPNGAQG